MMHVEHAKQCRKPSNFQCKELKKQKQKQKAWGNNKSLPNMCMSVFHRSPKCLPVVTLDNDHGTCITCSTIYPKGCYPCLIPSPCFFSSLPPDNVGVQFMNSP